MSKEEESDLFKDVELESPSNTNTSPKDVIVDESAPSRTSPAWHDYVMGFFEEDELFEKRPTAYGLRRVAELLLGEIVFSGVEHFVPPPQNGESIGRATVVWKIIFSDGATFIEIADSWEANTDDIFCPFATATAATRAEGRALRKALRLKTVTAEEMTKKDTKEFVKTMQTKPKTNGEYNPNDRMTANQERYISGKSKVLNINVAEFLKKDFQLSTSKKITKSQASNAIEKLNEYQQNKTSIPDNILGYTDNWS